MMLLFTLIACGSSMDSGDTATTSSTGTTSTGTTSTGTTSTGTTSTGTTGTGTTSTGSTTTGTTSTGSTSTGSTSTGSTTTGSTTTGTTSTGWLRINEAMPSSPDWLELHNGSTVAVDLTDWSVSDDYPKDTPWTFPPGTVVAPGGYLVVWCDAKSSEALNTDFALSKGGETLTLLDADGIVTDELTWPAVADDEAWGRLPDGADTTGAMTEPTPGSANY